MITAFLSNYIKAFLDLFFEMAPYLLLGFLFAGILHGVFRSSSLARHLGKPGLGSSIKAALLGVPLPLCSCGVIPTGISLHKHGASKGATVSFLISTPQTGIDSIFATSALMGWPMALVRPIAAFLTGVVGGYFTDRGERNAPRSATIPSFRPAPTGSQPLLRPATLPNGSIIGIQIAAPVAAPASASCSNKDSCSCSSVPDLGAPATSDSLPLSWSERIREALRYGFIEMLSGIAKWLLIGLAVAALISLVVPDEFFARYLSNYWLSVAVVLLVSVPLYVCATGSIPVAMALMMKGLSPGVAFVFLMAGPATMASTIALVGKALGRKALAFYLASIIVGAVFFGFLIDTVLPSAWFILPMGHMGQHQHESLMPMWFQTTSGALLAGLLLYTFWERYKPVRTTAALSPEVPMITRTYAIETITCNNCKRHLEKDVGVLPGVVRVNADIASSTLTVEGSYAEADVRKAVAAAGYQVVQG